MTNYKCENCGKLDLENFEECSHCHSIAYHECTEIKKEKK